MKQDIMKDEKWKKIQNKEQYNILRKKGTEKPFTGKWLNNKKKGKYYCIGCGNLLFLSEDKFDSGTGWPSFTKPANNRSVKFKEQGSFIFGKQKEVLCSNCKGHLGHVFNDGPTKKEHPNGTGKRFCINGNILKFKDLKGGKDESNR
jgi:peptide-methionine (R)-S-oxide reductase